MKKCRKHFKWKRIQMVWMYFPIGARVVVHALDISLEECQINFSLNDTTASSLRRNHSRFSLSRSYPYLSRSLSHVHFY